VFWLKVLSIDDPSVMTEFNDGSSVCLVVEACWLDSHPAYHRTLDLALLVCARRMTATYGGYTDCPRLGSNADAGAMAPARDSSGYQTRTLRWRGMDSPPSSQNGWVSAALLIRFPVSCVSHACIPRQGSFRLHKPSRPSSIGIGGEGCDYPLGSNPKRDIEPESRTKKSNVHYPPSIGITAPTTTASCLAMLESTTGQCADSNPVSGDYPVMTRHPEIRTTAQLIVGIPRTPVIPRGWGISGGISPSRIS